MQDELITDSGLRLYLDPSYSKEWKAAVTATIVELPIKVNPKDKNILAQLYPGDEVAMAYQVVADFEFQGDGGQFMPMTEGNDYVREFINGRGEVVRVYALPKRSGFKGAIWCGILQNKHKQLIDGVQGNEEAVEKWLSQFPFGKTDNYSFNNLFHYKGKDYWKCYPLDIFAKKVKGHWVAIGDRVICSPIDEKIPDQYLIDDKGKHEVKIRHQDRAMVLSSPKGIGFKKGEVISFEPQYLEKYELGSKQYFLINQRLINGKWN